MSHLFLSTRLVCIGAAIQLATCGQGQCADSTTDLRQEVEQLRQENKTLRNQVHEQETLIENLGRRVTNIEKTSFEKASGADHQDSEGPTSSVGSSRPGLNFGLVNLSGEGGIAMFDSQRNGIFPNTEFRVDEAKLFVEAPVWNDVYIFTELNLAAREYNGLELAFGELYLDFESVSKLWGHDRQLSLRIGRMDLPFGEEYLSRDAIDNPLISHSVSDVWGVDEGVELYGSFGKFGYVVAVQSGSPVGGRDFTSDKSVAGRLYYDPTRSLHLSVSAMRTGDLNAVDDYWSETYFGGGWFKSIGSTNTTGYHAEIAQGDLAVKLAHGHLKAFGGLAHYDDNDPAANNQRDFYYYAVEGVLNVTKQFYAAARFSQIFVEKGYPLPGLGDLGRYYYNPLGPRAEDIWRCSLGIGYRFSPHLLLKTEYSFEGGKESGGGRRQHVNEFAIEAAFGF